jgi:hypothetical protein
MGMFKEMSINMMNSSQASMGIDATNDNKLVVEYVLKPVTTTSLDFMYRFKNPIPTVWTDGAITSDFSGTDKRNFEERLKDFAMEEYMKMVANDGGFLQMVIGGVELKECDIVRMTS